MLPDWLSALRQGLRAGHAAVLVSVARTQGSAPRDAGTTMLVDATCCADTIGGGHLEFEAIREARAMLGCTSPVPRILRYNLGARLGQCCGGVVWLLFEQIPASDAPAWEARWAPIEAGNALERRLDAGASASSWALGAAHQTRARLEGEASAWRFEQTLVAEDFPVYLFGAGHVARALVRQMLPLGAAITWVDTRDDGFDGQADLDGLHRLAPGRLRTQLTDTPEAEVAQAPAGSFFIIMTHSHALDFSLCEAVFRRRDFAYFGLIGSDTKRASFEGRLKARGLPPERLGELTCPIGIPGIPGKAPAEIALAVGAELMQVRYAHQLLKQAGQASRPHNTLLPE